MPMVNGKKYAYTKKGDIISNWEKIISIIIEQKKKNLLY